MQAIPWLMCLFVAYGLAAPVPPEERELEKRRESTPEIMDLEKQLKKAAGEDKQYFTNENSRPMPQIDGLDTNQNNLNQMANPQDDLDDNEIEDDNAMDMDENDLMNMVMGKEGIENDKPEEANDYNHVIENSDGNGGDEEPAEIDQLQGEDEEDDVDEDDDLATSDLMANKDSTMWQLLKQHPELMEDLFRDYMGSSMPVEEQRGNPDNNWLYEDEGEMDNKRVVYPNYPYADENELMNMGPVIPQKGMYMPDDRDAYVPGYMDENQDSIYDVMQNPFINGQNFPSQSPKFNEMEDEEQLDSLMHQNSNSNEDTNTSNAEDEQESGEVDLPHSIKPEKEGPSDTGIPVPPHPM